MIHAANIDLIKNVRIIQLDMHNTFIKQCNSMSQVAHENNMSKENIWKADTCGDYKWIYADEPGHIIYIKIFYCFKQ
jgi:hypothetical protein